MSEFARHPEFAPHIVTMATLLALIEHRVEYVSLLKDSRSPADFAIACQKSYDFVALNIRMMAGSISCDEGLEIIKALKKSPFSIELQNKLIGHIDDRVVGVDPVDVGKEKAKDVPMHDFFRQADWEFMSDASKILDHKFSHVAHFIKEIGWPRLSEKCLAKLGVFISHFDNPLNEHTVDERLTNLQSFKDYIEHAAIKGGERVADMPTTPEEFQISSPMWYDHFYRTGAPAPAKIDPHALVCIHAKKACRSTKTGSSLQKANTALSLVPAVKQPVMNRGVQLDVNHLQQLLNGFRNRDVACPNLEVFTHGRASADGLELASPQGVGASALAIVASDSPVPSVPMDLSPSPGMLESPIGAPIDKTKPTGAPNRAFNIGTMTKSTMGKIKGTDPTNAPNMQKIVVKKGEKVQKKPVGKTANKVQKKPAVKTVAAKKPTGKTAAAKHVDVVDNLSKFPGTSYMPPLQFPPCTVYFCIPNASWRIKSKPGSRKTEHVKFTSEGRHSKAQWEEVVKRVKAYQK